jgi:SpoVK/Ycf46/Vps4 family AAA+-type ATPase
MSVCATPLRAELLSLPLQARIRRIDYDLAANRLALASRNERLLALRGDFDALTLDFWKAFGRSLGCEDPAATIAHEQARLRSIGYLSVVFCALTLTVWVVAGLQASGAMGLAVCVGAVGLLGSGFFIAAPFRQLARAEKLALVLGREQEPFWLTGGAIAMSNLGITPPTEAQWWWPDRTVFVFVRHLTVRFSLDALTGEPVWTDPALGAELSSPIASQILKDLLSGYLGYRQMVTTFQGLADLENDLTVLTALKAETEQALAAELREAEEPAAKLRREAQDRRSAQPQEARQEATEASGGASDPRQGVRVHSEPTNVQKASEQLTWNDLIIEDTLREKLQTYCEILRQAEAFRARGVTTPKGLLFYGPPGTGKTMTARVLAAQSGCAFVGCTTADIKQKWIGASGQAVKEIFASARATAPTILFVDELEAITNDIDGNLDTITAELTAQLLQEIDGIQSHPQTVFLIGATNKPDRINRALFNRFTEKIEYPLPSLEQRIRLLDLLIGRRSLTPGTSRVQLLEYLGGLSDGASGRDLRTMVERATVRSISRARAQGHSLDFALMAEDFQSDDGGEASSDL